MMKFTLKRFGGETFEFDEKSVITFPAGLPGFETCKRFKLINEEGKPTLFFLQSLDNPSVMFSLRDPALLNLSYEVTLTDAEQRLLETAPGDELIMMVIVFMGKMDGDGSKPIVKANALGPIILNVTKHRGMQKVLKELKSLRELNAQVAISGV